MSKRAKKAPLEICYCEDDSSIEIGIDEAGRGPMLGRVYTAAVVSLVFGVALFFTKLEHAEQLKEMEKDTLVLVSEFELAIQEHEELIDFHVEVNQKLGQELNKAGMIINMQKQVIQQLVHELQKAGVIPKPPTEPQRDPSLAI